MKTSLIITTYNWKEALELCVESVFRQIVLPDEIIIADDGSRDDTAETIRELAERSPVPLIHVWQPDEGFRLAASRNGGILASTGDYLIFVDGDFWLDRHFIEDHKNAARPGHWIQGSRVLLQEKPTERILASGKMDFGLFSPGIQNRVNMIRSKPLSFLCRKPRKKFPWFGCRGCNMSFWREDVFRVNGFNESFDSWGHEDWEFIVRLTNSGVVRSDLKFAAGAFHLFHATRPMKASERNIALTDEAIREHHIRCENGLEQHPLRIRFSGGKHLNDQAHENVAYHHDL